MSPPREREKGFVEYLEQLVARQDRAALAALRRGLGKRLGEAAEPVQYVYRGLPYGLTQWEEESYYLVAALFALWHQGKTSPAAGELPANLGASLAQLAPSGADNRDAVERRFVALLNCHPDDLPEHLRHAISLLKSDDKPINWAQLLQDIQWWGSHRRTVQLNWARAFWGQTPAAAAGPDRAEEGTPSSDDEDSEKE